ncbi:unnamed protein product [Effrenium voratum]|nr:unnamed protein product [Effrenium voratum]
MGPRRRPASEDYYDDYEYYSYYSESRSPTPKPRRRGRDKERGRRRRDRSRSRGRRHAERGGRGGGRGRSRDRRPPGGRPMMEERGRPGGGGGRSAKRTPSRDGEPSNAYVWNALIDREKARIDRNFSEADRVRDSLRERGIEIYDRERRWEAKDGRVGQRPNHDDKKRDD